MPTVSEYCPMCEKWPPKTNDKDLLYESEKRVPRLCEPHKSWTRQMVAKFKESKQAPSAQAPP